MKDQKKMLIQFGLIVASAVIFICALYAPFIISIILRNLIATVIVATLAEIACLQIFLMIWSTESFQELVKIMKSEWNQQTLAIISIISIIEILLFLLVFF